MAVGVSLGREMERHFNLPGASLDSSLQRPSVHFSALLHQANRFHFGPLQPKLNPIFRRFVMSINVKLSETLVDQARRYAAIEHRSLPKQIEYWSRIGKIAEENPDLPFAMIREILIADQEVPVGEYQFG